VNGRFDFIVLVHKRYSIFAELHLSLGLSGLETVSLASYGRYKIQYQTVSFDTLRTQEISTPRHFSTNAEMSETLRRQIV